MTDQDLTSEAVERFITQYESGQQGCHMDVDDAQAFAATLRAQAVKIERLQDSLDLLRRQHAVTERCLGNLLATIHRDGGHHRAENGDERSTEDAIGLWADLTACAEAAEADARTAYARGIEDAAKVVDDILGELYEHQRDTPARTNAANCLKSSAAATRALAPDPEASK